MPPTVPSTPADRFARLVEGLCRAIAARAAKAGLATPLLVLVWSRLRRMAARFTRLAARIQAGRLPAARRPTAPRPGGPPPRRFPRGFAWLVRLVPGTAAGASQLQYLLADPEMAALLAAAPQAGRILRPLCRMLGVRPPPGLAPPPPAPPPVPPAAAPRPAAGRPASAASPPPRPPPGPAPRAGPYACGPPVAA